MRERYALKCPSCREEALIQRGDTNYECIYCGYKKDLETYEPGSSSLIIWGFIFLIILIAILQDVTKPPATPLAPTNAPSTDAPGEQRYPYTH
ncbi:MAG: hypothetical protein KME27_14010 [Lyngbya sp. HA4199-MV5]|jgi:uncharacterized protein (DUF983 family)|nr:hypothetical protein [Lyngbya sp. HA4199-MV5]